MSIFRQDLVGNLTELHAIGVAQAQHRFKKSDGTASVFRATNAAQNPDPARRPDVSKLSTR